MALAKRIIPCLDVKDGQVVKGIQFKGHQIVGDIINLAHFYNEQGADELVFYDITASCEIAAASTDWVLRVAKEINIPFCVAGGIRNLAQAEAILHAGADKISINSPAIENPDLITQFSAQFGQQCVVVGIDSRETEHGYEVYQYTGDISRSRKTALKTLMWVTEVEQRGAGEIVLNCMNQDGMRKGYDLKQLKLIREHCSLPLIASGGAGTVEHFREVFSEAKVDGALAASVFHTGAILIPELKNYLKQFDLEIRL